MIIAAVAGCEATAPAPSAPPTKLVAPVAVAATKPATAPASDWRDEECAANLHHFEELFMRYYARNQRLPAKLSDLLALNGGVPLVVSCPGSGYAYKYFPDGLAAVGDARMVIMVDPAAVHGGKKRAILLTPPKDGRAMVMEVVLVTDEILKAFKPAQAKP
jgi:hypothetical protein